MEAETGQVLFEENIHLPRAPASTTKLMTSLVVMEQIAAGRVALSDSVRISPRSRGMGGTQVYLQEGEIFTLEELMQAVLIASANDAAVAVGEYVGGTYENFIGMMNAKARSLGLKDTYFYNSHGLDDVPNRHNVTSAYDLAQIARDLLRFPKVLDWTSRTSAPFRDGCFTLNATNRLLGRIEGMDGLKTGFTSRAGFCLVATAERRDMRLVAVILGSQTSRGRFRSAQHLLEMGFTWFQVVRPFKRGEPLGVEIPVAGGKTAMLRLVAGQNLSIVVPRTEQHLLKHKTFTVGLAEAPVTLGARMGYCEVLLGGKVLGRVSAVASRAVSKASFVDRLWMGLGFGRDRAQGIVR
jgi:D-alanyl-D-alanine carboxypeptidase (penicillin-binding protein 5/6)